MRMKNITYEQVIDTGVWLIRAGVGASGRWCLRSVGDEHLMDLLLSTWNSVGG